VSLHIAVGVLRRGRQVLISQRREGKPGAGQWEFPGGKCEPGESIQAALRRELVEELGIHLRHCQPLIRLRHRYPDREVLLDTWLVDAWSADPTGLEGQAVRWVDVCELSAAGLLEADRPIIKALEMPALYAVTPPDVSMAGLKARCSQLDFEAMVRLRLPSLSDAAYRALVLDLWRVDGPHLVVDRPHVDWDADLPAGALSWHAPARQVRAEARPVRPVWARWCIASCHDADDCDAAITWGADALVIGNLRATPTHPDRPGIGWQYFRQLADARGQPCYAIGGLAPSDLTVARWAGATGVAGIRGFWS